MIFLKILHNSCERIHAILDKLKETSFYVAATRLLHASCTEVTYAYNRFVESMNPAKISVSHLGIGDSLHTWHGTPDAQCRAEGGSFTHVITSGDANHESPGDSFIVEAKRLQAGSLFSNFRMQFSAEANISSFISQQPSSRPEFNGAIGLSITQTFVVALYDVSNDLLLVSEEVPWRTAQAIISSGVMLLWAVFHHR